MAILKKWSFASFALPGMAALYEHLNWYCRIETVCGEPDYLMPLWFQTALLCFIIGVRMGIIRIRK